MNIIEVLSNPWPWYISGPLLGLTVPLLLIIGNKQLGISSVFCHVNSALGLKKIELFNYDWKQYQWNILFVLGLTLSGVITNTFFNIEFAVLSEKAVDYFANKSIIISDAFPDYYFNSNILSKTSVLLIFGGFSIGFGSRYANGCTAGHAIMGLSLFNIGSLVAVIGFFVGGLLGTFLIIDNIL